MVKTEMPFAPPKTYQNKKSFWIFQTYPQILAKRHFVSSKICFMNHPNVHSIQIKYIHVNMCKLETTLLKNAILNKRVVFQKP